MAKPIAQFCAVAYDVNGYQGLRPQLIKKEGVVDLDLCREIVNERRLTTSPEELFHGFSSLVGVAMKKVAEDGRPRAITKLIKFAPYATGKLESPSSPWNETCKANIRAILLSDAKMTLDATFQNVTDGIGVKLNDVTWIGAKTVQNVLKIGADFSANGSHMEFLPGDTATLVIGKEEYALENKGSDVSRAVFAFPTALEGVEPGTQALFVMKSRGGIEDGQVYTSKKVVTILAGDAPRPTLKVTSSETGGENEVKLFTDDILIEGTEAANLTDAYLELYDTHGEFVARMQHMGESRVERIDGTHVKYYIRGNTSTAIDAQWEPGEGVVKLVIARRDAENLVVPMTVK